jgi:hypothetical protein
LHHDDQLLGINILILSKVPSMRANCIRQSTRLF